jgi:hypothetical protein
MLDPSDRKTLTLKAFLSHRYESPAVNTYFYEMFAAVAEVQFDVDAAKGATNVTRLERMIRDADAFVGIYPYEEEGQERPSREQLLKASRYFRLELELAARARTPSIVFVDDRYGPVIGAPASMFVCPFDYREVTGSGGSRKRENYRRMFERFCEHVEASMQYERTRPDSVEHSVALVLPPDVYDGTLLDALESAMAAANVEVERLPWPLALDARLVSRLQAFDWIVADVGTVTAEASIMAYLHGQFLPTLRLCRGEEVGDGGTESLETILYGAHDVGYQKDIIRWTQADELLGEFNKRLTRILQEGRRIGSTAEARDYFLEAARRKEAVFVSYSGRDESIVAPVAAALRRRFQSVFDYRDGGESIEAGRPWLSEIFEKLDRSAVAVPMLSASYLASGNCTHEVRAIVAARDAGKISLVPIKLLREDLELPPFLTDIQYIRLWEHSDPEAVVDRIVKALAGPK